MKLRTIYALIVAFAMFAFGLMVLDLITDRERLEAQPAYLPVTANRCLAVTTSDTADLAPFAQSGPQYLTAFVYVGGAGNVTGVLSDGSTILFTAPPVGSILPVAFRRINATGTTATVLVACYRY